MGCMNLTTDLDLCLIMMTDPLALIATAINGPAVTFAFQTRVESYRGRCCILTSFK